MSRNKLIAIIAAVLLIGVGIGSCATEDPGADVSQATTAPTAAPLPTVTFGPEPVITPTIEPTEEPIPTDTPDVVAYVAYLDWANDWASENVTLLQDLGKALEDTDAAEAASIARQLRTRYRDGIAWLEANPPAACYAEVHALSLSAARDFDKSSTAQIRWLEDFPYGTQADYDTFEKYVTSGTETLGKANDIDPDC